jgi:hypothetical protein
VHLSGRPHIPSTKQSRRDSGRGFHSATVKTQLRLFWATARGTLTQPLDILSWRRSLARKGTTKVGSLTHLALPTRTHMHGEGEASFISHRQHSYIFPSKANTLDCLPSGYVSTLSPRPIQTFAYTQPVH